MSENNRPTVLITGCSSGFGLAAAVASAQRGWRVFATMRDLGRREALDKAVAEAGVAVEVLELDVCDQESVDRTVAQVLESTGARLDALVNNAGIGDAGFFEETSPEGVRRVMETNFFGVLATTRAVLPAMRRRRAGRVVMVSSIGAFAANAALSVYVASKWAVEGWAEALSGEVAPFGVDIVLVEPGAYRTMIWDSAVIASVDGGAYTPLREKMVPHFLAMIDRSARDPKEVGERIANLLGARKPRFRNPVGPDSHTVRLLRHLVPESLRLRLLRRMVGMPAKLPETTPTPVGAGETDGD